MADDAISVLDALEWDSAHIVGVSLGGMIAQMIAIRSPARVHTLTCISSTPYWRIGRKKLSTSIRTSLARRGSGRPRTAEQFAEQTVRGHRVIGSPGYPLDEPWLRQAGHACSSAAASTRARPAARAQPSWPPATSDPTSPT